MRHNLLYPIFVLGILHAGNAAADSSQLKGDYAFTGTLACLTAPGSSPTPTNPTPGVMLSNAGFDPTTLHPKDGHVFSSSGSVEGIRTFNGDGTGTIRGTDVSITIPPTPGPPGTYPSFPPGASSDTFTASFTYTVNNDGTVDMQLAGPLTGTFLAGGRAGQTFSVDTIPVTAIIADNGKTLTVASVKPTVETITFSNGDVWPRICHRSRVLVKID